MSDRITVLGIDLSLRGTGLCFLSGGLQETPEIVASIRLPEGDVDVERDRIERMISLSNKIVDLARPNNLKAVGLETPYQGRFFHKGFFGLLEAHGVVKTKLFVDLGIVPWPVPVMAARKSVLGHGVKKKEDAIAELEALLNHKFPSEDEADAYFVARHVWMGLQAGVV